MNNLSVINRVISDEDNEEGIMKNINSVPLHYHYNIELEFNNNGKSLNEILKEHFLIYIIQSKKNKIAKKLWIQYKLSKIWYNWLKHGKDS